MEQEQEKGTEQQQVALVGDRHQAVTVNSDSDGRLSLFSTCQNNSLQEE